MMAPHAVVMALLEPFDTGVLPFAMRLTYWAVLITILVVGLPAAVRAARRLLEAWTPADVAILGAACALVSAPVTAAVITLDWLLARHAEFLTGGPPPDSGAGSDDTFGPIQTYLLVLLVVGLLVGLTSVVLFAYRMYADHEDPPLETTPGIRFLSRLPVHLGADLVCIRMEDHYLRVTTQAGEALILMRMRDAMDELQAYPGLRVHRSWWIATPAILRIARKGGRLEVVLSNGRHAPVSSTYKPTVEALVLKT